MYRSMLSIGCLFLSFSMAAQTPTEELVQSDLEKMRSMTYEESLSYMKRTYTMRSMEVLAKMLEAWRLRNGRYPEAASIGALRDALSEIFDGTGIPVADRWGTEFRYTLGQDRKHYRIVSAGGDRTFDETSWTRREVLPTDDDDAVLADGAFVRRWGEATRPGLGERANLTGPARKLLSKADAQFAANDNAGALASYIDAVKADSRAADLESIRRYSSPSLLRLPPPPPPRSEGSAPAPSIARAPGAVSRPETELQITALRQYLHLHPGDPGATRDLVGVLPAAQALAVAETFLAGRSADPDAYEMRAAARSGAGHALEALADLEKAASLDAANAERQYKLAVAAYEVATKTPSIDVAEVRGHLRQSLAALARAESLRPGYFDALMYRSIVLRKLSELETDATARQRLSSEAEAARIKAMESVNGNPQKRD